jgi:hypothetical protein
MSVICRLTNARFKDDGAIPIVRWGRKAAGLFRCRFKDSRVADYLKLIVIICKFWMCVMKKMMFALVVLMGVVCAQTASAAVLTWESAISSGTDVSGSGTDSIDVTQHLALQKGSFSYTYQLSSSANTVLYLMNSLSSPKHSDGISFSSVILDGVELTDFSHDSKSWSWEGQSLSAGLHTITLNGLSNDKFAKSFELTVNAVPVPAAIWLFGSGIAGLVGFSRRKAALAV